MPEILFLDADTDFDAGLTITDETSGEPVTGLTVTAYIAPSPQPTLDSAIHADLEITLTETPALSGIYVGVIQGSAITARLCNAPVSWTNKRVYLLRKTGSDWHRPRACRVRDGRLL